ncbi:sperm-specific sodium:proton exchanger [Anabrus simplex]|uniref:sperm-specific sodium:proton exchanger n=1 Tax=Anabrus simplex TaxID=316456 RepID=UPI0035A275BC
MRCKDVIEGREVNKRMESPHVILFIFLTFGIGAIFRSIMRSLNLHIPYTAIVFIFGGCVGWLSHEYTIFEEYTVFSNTKPKHILTAFLPALIFKTAFSMDAHTFLRSFPQIIIVAVPGFLISASCTGIIMKYLFDYKWSWEVAFLFGIIISTIYPYEVVALLRELGQSEHVSILLEGEALLTDGSAMVCFNILHGYITSQITDGVSGSLAIVVLGVIVSSEKTSISTDIENFLRNFWNLLGFISNTMIFMLAGVIITKHVAGVIQPRDIVYTLTTYLICNFTRLVSYLLMSPILSRIGYGLTWKNAAVAIWSGLRGAVCLLLSCIVFDTPGLHRIGAEFLIHVAAVVMLSLTTNGSTILLVLRLLGMSEISLAKKANMTNAVRYLADARDRSIGILKMDRFLADANWVLVEEGTRIKHPYKIEIEDEDEDDDDFYMGYRLTTCPDCQKEVPSEPTAREFKEMTKEAYLRILKAKKVSYWRQFEHGMLSKEGIRVLVGTVEVAADRDKPVMNVDDLKACWKERGCVMFLRRKIIDMMSASDLFYRPPRERWRMKYYKTAVNKWFDIFIYVAIILNSVPIILEIYINPHSKTPLNILLKILNNIFFLIYFIEFLIKVFGLGFVQYLKSHWNKLDFFIVIMSSIDLVFDYLDLFTDFDKASSTASTLTTASKLLRILRLARLCRLLRASLPKAVAYLDNKMDMHLSEGYDIGKGFVTGEEEILKLLVHIVDNPKIMEEIKQKVENDRLTVTKKLGLLQRDRPWIAVTVKTRQAIRSILNNLKDAVFELKDGGLLDDAEFIKLLEMVEERLKYSRTHYKMVQPCPPQILLKEVPWVVGDEAVASFLLENTTLVNFNYGETMITHGSNPEGIYVLVSGLVKLTYMPSEKTLKNLQNYGALPNVDYFTTLRFNERQEDYIISGNVIGELGVLTCRPYDVTISCETSVQAYEITMDVIQEAMKISYDSSLGLRTRMWKAIAIRIANVILMSVPAYQSWSQEKIKYHLERAFVPTLTGFSVFVVNDLMEDVLLIEGQAMDANSRFIFFAPTYIPRTVQKIFFPKCSMMNVETPIETKLLIIPAKDVDEYDIMETAEFAEMISTASSRCLQHTIQSRTSGARSQPSRKMKGRGRRRNVFGYSTSRNRYDKETHVSTKSSFAQPFASSKVFPDIQPSYSHPYTSEGHALTFEQLNSSSEPPATDDTKEEKISSVRLNTSASIHERGKNNSEVSVEEKESRYRKNERSNTSHEERELVVNDLTDDDDEEKIILQFKTVPMADLKEEEEDDNTSEKK